MKNGPSADPKNEQEKQEIETADKKLTQEEFEANFDKCMAELDAEFGPPTQTEIKPEDLYLS